ncbi:sodium- and chloride-dependent GABA transporter 1-like [Symsagittifera roscoffensis]|uniref:sodium- and chloride-dependent GABA transporter 1-like n=1 Tax=Symsagittifera roscoffensis TaxID=84072 RepID=UPI00307BBB67
MSESKDTGGDVDKEKQSSESQGGERESWGGKLDFILSCVGYAVGLGNVWRFPYLCYKNGGGAFLIPYGISVIFMGIPLFMLEVSVGQFMSIGGLGVWKLCPIFKGVGWAAAIVACWLNVYYIVVIAWALYYLFNSFTTNLPWARCDNEWNDENCITGKETAAIMRNQSSANKSLNLVPAVQQYWYRKVLDESSGIDEPGILRWELAITLFIAWLLCYFCIWKGVKQTGKVVYFTALFPYVVLTVLLVRGLTLDGALDGLEFFLKPNMTKLLEPNVWMDAGSQVFFSYGVALGSLIALGSYNHYNNNCYRDAMIVGCINSCTSLFAGCVIFSNLGYMAWYQGKNVSDVAQEGPGLLFQVYPEAVTLMPLSQVWSVMFFFMVLLLGLDSQFCTVEGFITAMVDEYPRYLRKYRPLFIGLVCLLSYVVGTSCISQGGIYMFTLLDTYSASGYSLLWLAFFETVSISWVFGANNFISCLEHMIGYRPHIWWKICWFGLTPAMIGCIFIFTLLKYASPKYGDTYKYPGWAEIMGWCMALSSMMVIPLYAFFKTLFAPGNSLREKLRHVTTPTPEIQARLNEILNGAVPSDAANGMSSDSTPKAGHAETAA